MIVFPDHQCVRVLHQKWMYGDISSRTNHYNRCIECDISYIASKSLDVIRRFSERESKTLVQDLALTWKCRYCTTGVYEHHHLDIGNKT